MNPFVTLIKRIIDFNTTYESMIVLILCFLLAIFLPAGKESPGTYTILTVIGILFGVILGFFITDLWTRFDQIRQNIGEEVSGWTTLFGFSRILANAKRYRKWTDDQRELIDKYIIKVLNVEWIDYNKSDKEFSTVFKHMESIANPKTNKETETYTNMLVVLNEISSSREKITVLSKDKLTRFEWIVIISLSITLLVTLFYLKTPEIVSIIFTGFLSSVVIIMLLILSDLSYLRFGESTVSYESYESVLDEIGKPRFYPKRDIKAGRVKPPKGVKYRVG